MNPSRGRLHPKLYLARHGDEIAAAVGSANLTSGLVANVERVAVLRGPRDAPEARHLVELCESWWAHPDAVDWSAGTVAAPGEVLELDLVTRATATIAADPVIVRSVTAGVTGSPRSRPMASGSRLNAPFDLGVRLRSWTHG
jgi:hypothetical protein